MNSFLLIWGFTSDRNLSSSEYQIYEKYQVESLVLNKLSNFHKLTTLDDALKILIAAYECRYFSATKWLCKYSYTRLSRG